MQQFPPSFDDNIGNLKLRLVDKVPAGKLTDLVWTTSVNSELFLNGFNKDDLVRFLRDYLTEEGDIYSQHDAYNIIYPQGLQVYTNLQDGMIKFEIVIGYAHKSGDALKLLNEIKCDTLYTEYKQNCEGLWDLPFDNLISNQKLLQVMTTLTACLEGRWQHFHQCLQAGKKEKPLPEKIIKGHLGAIEKMRHSQQLYYKLLRGRINSGQLYKWNEKS